MASVTKPASVGVLHWLPPVEVVVNNALVEKQRFVGTDMVVYEWDWSTGTWKSWQA